MFFWLNIQVLVKENAILWPRKKPLIESNKIIVLIIVLHLCIYTNFVYIKSPKQVLRSKNSLYKKKIE